MSRAFLAGLRLTGAAAVVTVIYYLLPHRGRLSSASWTVLFVCGVVVLAVLILLAVSRLLRAGPEVRLQRLFVLLCVAIVFFAEMYYLLALMPGQFDSLHTRTDALYFTITTLSTVGYGDVHATGQLARDAVTIQIVFDLTFLGTAIAVGGGLLRAKGARLAPHDGQDQQSQQTPSPAAAPPQAPQAGASKRSPAPPPG